MYKLNGKICVVTGAAKSVGLAVAEAFCKEGASVMLLDIDQKVVENSVQLHELGYHAKGYVLDITDKYAVMQCFREIEERNGAVDVLVNNAGVVDQRPFEEITPQQINRIMQVNVNGTLYCTQAVAPGMKAKNCGRVINFSSKSGKTGSAMMAHYSAAKGAIISLTHAIAFELAPHNIMVNCLCPGIIESTGVWNEVSSAYSKNLDMPCEEVASKFASKIPLGRLAAIEDIVAFTMFLASDANYCTGQAFNVTGGREVH